MTASRFWQSDQRLAYWHPVMRRARLGRKPRSIRVCGIPITVYISETGSVAALYDRCAHRRAPLSRGSVREGGLECPYHGCVFAEDGSGYCPTTRSTRFRIPVFETRVVNGVIWLRSKELAQRLGLEDDAGINPDLFSEGYRFAGTVSKSIAAPLQLVVDNMTELEHTGTVHTNLAFGIDDFDSVETLAEERGNGVYIYYRGRQRSLPLYLRMLSGLKNGDTYIQEARVAFTPPNASYVIDWSRSKGGAMRPFGLRFVIYYTEVDADRTQLFAFVYWRAEGRLRQALMSLSAPVLRNVVSAEIGRDKDIIELLPPDEANMSYFQLSHFDRPLPMTRKLMARQYPPGGHGRVEQHEDTGHVRAAGGRS